MPVTRQQVCVGGAVGGCKPILVFSLSQAEQLYFILNFEYLKSEKWFRNYTPRK